MSDSVRMPVTRGERVTIVFGGKNIPCFEGETIASALLVAGVDEFGVTRDGAPRQPFCNMGTCFDCAVTVDGTPLVRACLTPVQDGMTIEPTKGF